MFLQFIVGKDTTMKQFCESRTPFRGFGNVLLTMLFWGICKKSRSLLEKAALLDSIFSKVQTLEKLSERY
ncbi:hypothetical protein D1614_05415 [Maribellus luteus]|uniref:Uncharacterized protein n=1 Tax=Maribellus luteus TaxID=2305463 RepID=A0A399T5F5_9BACT|nr:hypothetical protein D1614_05415 [Maribellus luteus]